MRSEHVNEIKGILLLALAATLFAGLLSYTPEDLIWFTATPNNPVHNWIGYVGAYSAGALVFLCGYSAYFFVIFFLFWSWNIFTSRASTLGPGRIAVLAVLVLSLSGLFSLAGSTVAASRFERGGLAGLMFADFLVNYARETGAYVTLSVLALLCLVVIGDFLVSPLIVRVIRLVINALKAMKDRSVNAFLTDQRLKRTSAPKVERVKEPKVSRSEAWTEDEREEDDVSNPESKGQDRKDKDAGRGSEKNLLQPVKVTEPARPSQPNIRILQTKTETPKPREDKPQVKGDYKLPPFDLLRDPPKPEQGNVQGVLVSGAKTLEQTLASFGVIAKVADIERGPVITRYELEPAAGVRVQAINALANDIALAMQAHSVRIQAPIPGKNRVGIEVPNGASAAVVLKDVLLSGNIRSGSKLTLALGKDIAGKPMLADLAAMPHLLVAGATGSGKSVCLNAIIMSILYNASPSEVKFIMVDPKMVELNQYNDLPHMLCPAITDHKKVVSALGWVVMEMESRYKVLSTNKVRNIAAYHEKGFEMPYIVIVIDEFADLMQTSGKVVESAVIRLAQLARAVGIHLILATQRPSVNVITGVIKANLPARVAFRVNSIVDSRTILDEKGADDLLGRGDMLFVKPGDPKPVRGQCSYVSDDEIHRVVEFIKQQQKPTYDNSVTARPAALGGPADGEKDEIFDDAVRVVMETGQASASMLQRRMGVGFSRAGRLIDQMERSGLVSGSAGSKSREILVDREKWLVDNTVKTGDVQSQPQAETQT